MIGKIISHYKILEKLGEGENPAYPGQTLSRMPNEFNVMENSDDW